ncbi:MAG: MBL fold metallo-hydrolase RNA specificity domain-containing protein [bacterium]
MKLTFHGAAQGVTGSCHLLEAAGKKILVDCGMYQGGHEIVEENSKPFGFEAEDIDYLLLTHAHLDHCGRIPLLVKRGFRGEIISTYATMDLAKLVMLDSAGLQEEEAKYQTRRARRRSGREAEEIAPLYGTLDVLNSLDFFGRRVTYGKPFELAPDIEAEFLDAGHILGSASVVLTVNDKSTRKRILFSGDLGYSGRAILRDPVSPTEPVDIVVMETTYGDRLHKRLQPSVDELYEVVNDTVRRGGNVIIPTFALERAQEILYFLREGVETKAIEHYTNVFLDSPMAISATEIFRRHPECFDEETRQVFAQGKDPFAVPALHFTRETADSIAINNISGGAVIMAGSGMCTGGRVRHHLKHNLWRRQNAVVFVGYAAQGTLARRIIDGADEVKIYGEVIPVNARIHTIGGFSAHADQTELLAWHARTGSPQRTFLVHGEDGAMTEFAKHLHGTKVEMPELHQSFEL